MGVHLMFRLVRHGTRIEVLCTKIYEVITVSPSPNEKVHRSRPRWTSPQSRGREGPAERTVLRISQLDRLHGLVAHDVRQQPDRAYRSTVGSNRRDSGVRFLLLAVQHDFDRLHGRPRYLNGHQQRELECVVGGRRVAGAVRSGRG